MPEIHLGSPQRRQTNALPLSYLSRLISFFLDTHHNEQMGNLWVTETKSSCAASKPLTWFYPVKEINHKLICRECMCVSHAHKSRVQLSYPSLICDAATELENHCLRQSIHFLNSIAHLNIWSAWLCLFACFYLVFLCWVMKQLDLPLKEKETKVPMHLSGSTFIPQLPPLKYLYDPLCCLLLSLWTLARSERERNIAGTNG